MLSIVFTFINCFCVNLFQFQAAMIGTSDAPPQNVLPFQNVYHNQVSQHSVFYFPLSISCTCLDPLQKGQRYLKLALKVLKSKSIVPKESRSQINSL